MCRGFYSEDKPDVHISMKQEDIEREKSMLIQYRDDDLSEHSLEFFALLRRISDIIINFDAFMIHGAVISVRESAYLFTAQSGIGKTTHIKKWLKNLPEAFVVNGDKPFIKISDDGTPPLACGSPWSGKERMHKTAAGKSEVTI